MLTRPDAPRRPRPQGSRPARWPQRADAAGSRCSPRPAARPGVPRPAARASARLLPGGRLRRAAAAGRARHPAARLGQPALLAAAGLARRRAGAARDPAGDDVTGATTFRLEAGWTPARCSGSLTEPIRPDDTAGDLLGRLARRRRRAARRDPRRDRGRHARGRAAAGRGGQPRPQDQPDDARVDWKLPAHVVDRQVRGVHPGPGRLDRRSTATGSSSGRSTRTPGRPARTPAAAPDLAPGELQVGRHAVLVGTGYARRSGWATSRPPGKRRMTAADWARGLRAGGPASGSADMPATPSARDRAARRAGPGQSGGPARGRASPVPPDRVPTRPGAPPTTCCARSPTRRLRQPAAARAARRARARPAATPPSPPSSPTARCAAGHARTRPRPRAATAGPSSTRRCSTCSGSARTSCWPPGSAAHAAVATTVDLAQDVVRPGASRLRQRGAAQGGHP